jgi:hypothetical protein
VPSAGEASASAPSGSETGKAATHHRVANAQPKKKKSNFMHKMRDKAMAKVQKLFGSKPESKQAPNQQTE